MQFSVQRIDQTVVFMLEGKLLNEQQTAIIRDRIGEELVSQRKKFILDLKGIEFVNSACLNFLVAAKNKIDEQGGRVILCNASDQLRRLLSVTRLDSFFKIAGRTNDALGMLNEK
jgi:anti-sigma B factor antagonist